MLLHFKATESFIEASKAENYEVGKSFMKLSINALKKEKKLKHRNDISYTERDFTNSVLP